jgi:uncharacterized protein (DUF2235 family)
VVKLAAMLDKRAVDQLLYYQPGIGTWLPPGQWGRLRTRMLTQLDLAFAIFLKYHVQNAYRFLMRYYEEGDEIYLFGFSRGAYTARVLAGMLHKVGLLARGNEELVSFAWQAFARADNLEEAQGFCATFSRRVPIEFLGVWDTVSSVRYAWRDQHFPYTYDNPSVRCVRQAMAIDERRAYFRQNLWIQPGRPGQDVRQVWFAGVHCDVGGGYLEAESGLAKIALSWMIAEVGARLAFDATTLAAVIPKESSKNYAAPSPLAKLHDSLRGLWHIIEWIPRRVHVKQPDGQYVKRWILPRGHRRWIDPSAEIHPSVFQRARLDRSYRPANLGDRLAQALARADEAA